MAAAAGLSSAGGGSPASRINTPSRFPPETPDGGAAGGGKQRTARAQRLAKAGSGVTACPEAKDCWGADGLAQG